MLHFSERVTDEKQLRGGVEFIDILPKNNIGKIMRKELRERVQKK